MEADPFLTSFVPGGLFIGRQALRTYLRSLTDPAGPRILVVDGPPGSGKSHTLRLIAYLSQKLQTFSVASISLEEEAFYALGPADVARSLALRMGGNVASMPAQGPAASRWILDLRDWLLGEVRRQEEKVWWFVLDGFDNADVPLETRDFVKHLIVAAHRATTTLRVVLLGWSEDLVPMNVRPDMLRETVPPVDRADVRQLFQQLSNDGVLPLDASGVEQVVDAIESVAAQSGSGDLASVAAEAVKRLQ